MADPAGFINQRRQDAAVRPVEERVNDSFEIELPHDRQTLRDQASRCMGCGVPFCHVYCPVHNRVPEWNDLIRRGKWRDAYRNLQATNNFPEITGRICPALCEGACTLSMSKEAVVIRNIELDIAERAFSEGWVEPMGPVTRSGKRVAVVGSGPAGLAAAQQLARAGHEAVVFEKDEKIGGLLRYGIPDFKLEKHIIDRRLEQLVAEGVKFETGVIVGEDLSTRYLRKSFDAICLTVGAAQPRELFVPGSRLENVHFAMDYLTQQNRIVAGEPLSSVRIDARNRRVVVIGGGDTGNDCVGTAARQGAREIHQLEVLPGPAEAGGGAVLWPTPPRGFKSSSSHSEGCHRRFGVLTQRLSGVNIHVTQLHGIEVEWVDGPRGKGTEMKPKPGTEFCMPVDLVLLALGFVHVDQRGLVQQLGLALDERGNIAVDNSMTSEKGIFAAGDAVQGASLVVHAIETGRQAAAAIDGWLGG